MKLPFRVPAIHLGPRARLVVRIATIVVSGIVAFVFALQLTFPYEKMVVRGTESVSDKYSITWRDVERGWLPGRFYVNGIMVRTRPTKPDEVPTTVSIDRLRVDAGIFALIGGTVSADIDAKIGTGHLAGNLTFSKSGSSVKLDGKDLPSARLPMKDIVGLPMEGDLDLSVDISLPNEPNKLGKTAPNFAKLEGEAELSCPANCVYGDGKTKLKTKLKNQRNQEFAKDGIEFGTLKIESLLAKVEIKNSRLEVTKFEAKSGDGELHVDYTMDLKPEWGDSMVSGCLRYKGSDALLKRDNRTFNAITLIGGALGPDKLFHVRLTDNFRDMKKLGQVCGAGSPNMEDNGPGQLPRRPNLTVQPDEPPRPPPTPTPPPGAGSAQPQVQLPPPSPAPPLPTNVPTTPGAAGSAGSAGSAMGSAGGSAGSAGEGP